MAVTFDDAFLSVAEFAYPIMSSLGLPGTVFVVTDFADDERPLAWEGITHWRDGEHAAELRGLSWPQLGDLAEAGWEIGSHTRTHPRLTLLDDERLADELKASRTACEQALGRPCDSIAYPYGDVDRRVVAAAQSAGYKTAATLPSGLPRGHTLSTPRIGVYRGDSLRRFRVKVSPRRPTPPDVLVDRATRPDSMRVSVFATLAAAPGEGCGWSCRVLRVGACGSRGSSC